jgi:hypothetical protein
MTNRCPKKNTLLIAWQAATQSYSEAVNEFAKNVGQVTSDDYERLKHQDDACDRDKVDDWLKRK